MKGEYNHSPFKVALPADFKKYEKIAIEVEYEYKQDSLNKVYLSMYNEIEYVNLGILDSNEGTNKQTFYIPKEELQKWSREKKEYSLPDVRYLDDNQTLIELLASESSSKKLKAYAKKWEKANELVPNEYLNNKQVDFKKNIEELYEIHGSDNDLSMDISIINGKEKFYISKNQYGDRNIHLYSELNGKLMDNGLIFNKNFEVGKNKISPSLVESKDNKYKLYFILENDVKQKTGDIYLSESEDGINWRNPKLFKQGSYCNISDYSYDENSYLFVTKKVGNATQLERINLKTLEYEHIYTTHSNVDGVIKETMGFNNDGVDYLMIKLVSERGGRYKFFDIASNEILNFEKGVYIDNPYINNGIIKTDFEHKFKNSKLYYISMQDNNGKSKAYISKADLGDLLLEQFPIKIATKSNINKKKKYIFNFGRINEFEVKGFNSVNIMNNTMYNKEKGFGWIGSNNRFNGNESISSTLIKGSVSGHDSSKFKIDVENGKYKIGILVGSYEKNIPRFEYYVNGKANITENGFSKERKFASYLGLPILFESNVDVTNGEVEINFGKNWFINALIIKPYENETISFSNNEYIVAKNIDFYNIAGEENAQKWSYKNGENYSLNWKDILTKRIELEKLLEIENENENEYFKIKAIAKYIDDKSNKITTVSPEKEEIYLEKGLLDSPVDILESGVGSCLGLARTIALIANSYGVPSRLISYYVNPNAIKKYSYLNYPQINSVNQLNIGEFHVECEIYWNGKWILIPNGPYVDLGEISAGEIISSDRIDNPIKSELYLNTHYIRIFSNIIPNHYYKDTLDLNSDAIFDAQTAKYLYPNQNKFKFRLRNDVLNTNSLMLSANRNLKGLIKLNTNISLSKKISLDKQYFNNSKDVKLILFLKNINTDKIYLKINGNEIIHKISSEKRGCKTFEEIEIENIERYLLKDGENEMKIYLKDGEIEIPVMEKNKIYMSNNNIIDSITKSYYIEGGIVISELENDICMQLRFDY